MQEDIHSTKLKQIDSPCFQFTVKDVHIPTLSMSLILFYLFSLSVLFYCSNQGQKTVAQAHAKKLKYLPMPFKLHIISDTWLSLHNTVNCDLSFENILALHS